MVRALDAIPSARGAELRQKGAALCHARLPSPVRSGEHFRNARNELRGPRVFRDQPVGCCMR
jgi:hypothetical protein